MDWETLVAISGIYILLIVVFLYYLPVSKKMLRIEERIMNLTESIQLLQTYLFTDSSIFMGSKLKWIDIFQ